MQTSQTFFQLLPTTCHLLTANKQEGLLSFTTSWLYNNYEWLHRCNLWWAGGRGGEQSLQQNHKCQLLHFHSKQLPEPKDLQVTSDKCTPNMLKKTWVKIQLKSRSKPRVLPASRLHPAAGIFTFVNIPHMLPEPGEGSSSAVLLTVGSTVLKRMLRWSNSSES